MTVALALPGHGEPVPIGFADAVRSEVEAIEDFGALDEYRARLAALEEYVNQKSQDADEIRRARRFVEMRIGSLLPREQGRRNDLTHNLLDVSNKLDRVERSELRALAEHPNIVEQQLAKGVTGRRQILKAIRKNKKREAAANKRDVPPPSAAAPTTFPTIVIDPPWQYGNTSTRGAAEDHYPTMSYDELAALELPATDDAHLYLWVTNNFIREGLELCDVWGFTFKTLLTWVKPQMGMGNYFRSVTEHVIFGIRGNLPTARRDRTNVINADRTRHSAKPDAFYDLVEQMSPAPHYEMFARRRRTGWYMWGNEA
jgi:N6-adenosine-specific RNA methylase IME4